MNTFEELRKLARDKRDQAINSARDTYSNTLDDINELQKQLIEPKPSLKGHPKSKVPMRDEIMEVAPKDSSFTIRDILDLPESEEASLRTTLGRMIKMGLIKRVARGRRNIPTVYAVAEYGPPVNELNDLPQIAAAQIVLRDIGRPVELVVLAVEMLERGYKPVNGVPSFKNSLHSAMRRKEEFIEADGLWSIRTVN